MGDQGPMPGTPYVQFADSRFLVRSPEPTVQFWYVREMPALGWVSNGSGYSGDNKTGITETMAMFARPGWAKSKDPVQITLTFYAPSPRETLVGIWATRVVEPARPKDSYLADDVVRITGRVVQYGTRVQTTNVSISKRASIHRVVSAINRLRSLMVGAYHCPMGTFSANLTFIPKRGRVIHVAVDAGCEIVSVDGIPLQNFPSIKPALLWAMAHP